MKATNRNQMTSYHGVNIFTTPQKLIDLSKKLDANFYDGNDGNDKVNFDFGKFETEDERVFMVYDWKEGRSLDLNESIEFHIGSENRLDSIKAKNELLIELLKK